MRKFYIYLFTIVILAGLPLGSSAQIVTVGVDCTSGDTINDALRTVADELTININGMCYEDVQILRSRVSLVGTDPLTDGIAPDGETVNRSLTIFGVNNINISKLRLVEGRFGLSINTSFAINTDNVIIEVEDTGYGIIVGSASGSIGLFGTTVTSVGTGTRGIWATNGSNVRCIGCSIDSFKTGMLASQGSEIGLYGTAVQATETAVAIIGGSRLFARAGCTPSPCTAISNTLDGDPSFSLYLQGTASAWLRQTNLEGKLHVNEKSVLTIRNQVTQSATDGVNWVSRGSSLIVDFNATLQRDYNISDFSNLVLPAGSPLGGALTCFTGADAYCADGNDITGGSNCNSCISPP